MMRFLLVTLFMIALTSCKKTGYETGYKTITLKTDLPDFTGIYFIIGGNSVITLWEKEDCAKLKEEQFKFLVITEITYQWGQDPSEALKKEICDHTKEKSNGKCDPPIDNYNLVKVNGSYSLKPTKANPEKSCLFIP